MGCKCAKYDSSIGRWQCDVSGSECVYFLPNSKRCAEEYGEGPDAVYEDEREGVAPMPMVKIFSDPEQIERLGNQFDELRATGISKMECCEIIGDQENCSGQTVYNTIKAKERK